MNPLILFGFFGIMIFILILNRPRFEDHPVKTKSNIAQVESQALHNIDKPVIDVSGWQRPEEINYDTLSQNISGAIVRVHSGAQSSKENDAAFVNGVDKAFKTHITEFQKRNVPVGVYFMEEHSIDTDKFTSVWIPSYGSNTGFFESKPNTDLDYDIHQYTSKGKIAGFEHDLDINVISSLKNKEETFRKLFLKP